MFGRNEKVTYNEAKDICTKMGLQIALPESSYENEQELIFNFFLIFSGLQSVAATEQIKKSSIKAILETVYNSYWIRIKKTNNDVVPYRSDDNFDQSLSYENWADFQTGEDDQTLSFGALRLHKREKGDYA